MADLPPSYEEVVKNPPVRRDQPSTAPSAPPLETITANPSPHDTQKQQSHPASSLPNPHDQDGRFSAWDDRATKILVVNRLDMNERFDKARNQLERHLIWNVILNHLLAAGYNFARIDLIRYWKHIFFIYKSIINSLHEGVPVDTDWKYFELIDNVFHYTIKRPKRSSEEDYDTVKVALPSQPMFSLVYNGIQSEPLIRPHTNEDVVTTQPRPSAQGYTTIPQSDIDNDADDDYSCCCIRCCWCCPKWLLRGCCADNPSAYIARAGGNRGTTPRGTRSATKYTALTTGTARKTAGAGYTGTTEKRGAGYTGKTVKYGAGYSGTSGGYTNKTGGNSSRNSGYTGKTIEYTHYNDDHYTMAIVNNPPNDNHYTVAITDNPINDIDSKNFVSDFTDRASSVNHHHSSSHTNDSRCIDNRADECCDAGGEATKYSCSDTSGISTNYHCSNNDTGNSSTNYGCSDTGGGSTDYGCNDTGGGSTDYGCSDTGGGDYSCGGGTDD